MLSKQVYLHLPDHCSHQPPRNRDVKTQLSILLPTLSSSNLLQQISRNPLRYDIILAFLYLYYVKWLISLLPRLKPEINRKTVGLTRDSAILVIYRLGLRMWKTRTKIESQEGLG